MKTKTIKTLFELIIYDYPKDGKCPFGIGVFLTEENARHTAERYLREVKGFKDYGCSYEITARQVFGAVTGCVVWQVEGWNEDSDGEETDILKSDFFGAEEDSNACCLELQKVHNRSNWVVDKHIIDKCSWEAGFSRYYY